MTSSVPGEPFDIEDFQFQLAAVDNDPSFDTVWDELIWRGLIHVSTDEQYLQKTLNDSNLTFYCGFDPTAPSLHLGNLVQLLTMRRLQLDGHKPLALVGGSTGLIGDPRPTAERTLNSPEVVVEWVEKLQNQIQKFLSFEGDEKYSKENSALLVNNLDWTDTIGVVEFLRDTGKYFRLGTMLKKDAVSARLNSEAGISYTEFSYQVLQAMDYLHLFRDYGCTLQTGGSDQWGNLVGGVELIHKAEKESVQAFGTPLITNADGTKFGKSEGNAIWLDPKMASPYTMYQFWLNTADADVIDRLKVFTFLTQEQINQLEQSVENEPHRRLAQKVLAYQVTSMVHGSNVVNKVLEASQALFGGGDLRSIDGLTFASVTDQLPRVSISREYLDSGEFLARTALQETGLVNSGSEARRAIKEGGAYINNQKVADIDQSLSSDDLLDGTYILMRRGKKNQTVIIVED